MGGELCQVDEDQDQDEEDPEDQDQEDPEDQDAAVDGQCAAIVVDEGC